MQTIEKEIAGAIHWNLDGEFKLDAALRQTALDYLNQHAFPTTRDEAWKYTRVTKIKNCDLSIQVAPIEIKGGFGIDEESLKFVFVNGHFAPQLSSKTQIDGLKIQALSQLDEAECRVLGHNNPAISDIFTAFNTAYTTDGLYVHVSAKMIIEPTIEIIQVNTAENCFTNLRHVVICEAFSQAKLIQRSISFDGKDNFTNVATEIRVEKNAKLTVDKLQEEADSCFQIAREWVTQAQDSTFTINTITLDGSLVRNDLTIDVHGQNCETNLNGAYLLSENQHVDNHTLVDHKVPNCVSNELYKGVIDGKATAVFNGKVIVRKDAQKINAFQSNANVLLSENASVNSKPELEIYADDVKCSHGSTTGQLDEEAVFYLRARGLSEVSARQLMVGAFVGDVFSKIENEAVLRQIHQQLTKRFNWIVE